MEIAVAIKTAACIVGGLIPRVSAIAILHDRLLVDSASHESLTSWSWGTVSEIASNSVRPMCPTCKHRLGLTRISPGKRGFEERTFECSTCERIEKISLPVDPMKTDAVGCMATEFKRPQ